MPSTSTVSDEHQEWHIICKNRTYCSSNPESLLQESYHNLQVCTQTDQTKANLQIKFKIIQFTCNNETAGR